MKQILYHHISRNGIRVQHALTTAESMQDDVVRPEIHEGCEISLMLSGINLSYHEGKPLWLTENDLCIVPPKTVHWGYAIGEQPYERLVLQFHPSLLPPLKDVDLTAFYKIDNPKKHVIPGKLVQNSNVKELMFALTTSKANYEQRDLQFLDIIFQLVETLNHLVEQSLQLPTAHTTHKSNITDKCLDYINEHILQDISAAQIAKALGVNAKYLQAAFKKNVGVSLYRYIRLQKTSIAKNMMLQGIPAQEIATKLGYKNYTTFHRMFRTVGSYAPRTYSKIGVRK